MPRHLPRVLERACALRLGFTARMIERRLASGAWRRLLPRTYLTSDTLTEDDRVAAALAFAGRTAVLSGAAALAQWRVRGVSAPGKVLVLVPPDCRLDSVGWVQVRRSDRP